MAELEIDSKLQYTERVVSTRALTLLDTEYASFCFNPEYGTRSHLFELISADSLATLDATLRKWLEPIEYVFTSISSRIGDTLELQHDIVVDDIAYQETITES